MTELDILNQTHEKTLMSLNKLERQCCEIIEDYRRAETERYNNEYLKLLPMPRYISEMKVLNYDI